MHTVSKNSYAYTVHAVLIFDSCTVTSYSMKTGLFIAFILLSPAVLRIGSSADWSHINFTSKHFPPSGAAG